MKLSILLVFLTLLTLSCQNNKGDYVCPPCGLECDNLSFASAGACPNCQMELILKSEFDLDLNLTVNEINIENGSGKFLVEGGDNKEKAILVHYHKPVNFSEKSEVIFVLPGAGRNGKDYRDAWIESSEKYNLLVLSIEYSDKHYPGFWNYNLAGMIYDVDIQSETFKINQNPKQWLFEDFDRIFESIKTELKLSANTYDMFGHSAGGQLLHRLSVFKPENKANRILASNSGWYTIPTNSDIFPYGLKNIGASYDRLNFSQKLVIFLGEKDDATETRGQLRRSSEADKQGLHRLERGTYFYEESKKIATELDLDFKWELEIVPDIGHDYKLMSQKAAEYLYGSE